MNERIRELLEEATEVYDDWKTGGSQRLVDHKMFAELIVRECAKVSERTGALNEADIEGEMIADAIKEHFGVK